MVWEAENDNIPFIKQYVSVAIIVINIIVFILQLFDPNGNLFVYEFGFIPSLFFQGNNIYTILTSMFMHGSIYHLISNLWFFYVIADNCEYECGHTWFAIVYLITGFAGSLLHGVFTIFVIPEMAIIPAVGASGAISGLMAMYLIFYPHAMFVVPTKTNKKVYIKAWQFILLWFLTELILGILMLNSTGVAHFAHIGGFAAGLLIGGIQKKLMNSNDK